MYFECGKELDKKNARIERIKKFIEKIQHDIDHILNERMKSQTLKQWMKVDD